MVSPSPNATAPQLKGTYTAVPGRLVPIPNTKFLLLLPDEEVPVVPAQPRERPRGKPFEPCTCPHCVSGMVGGQERHLCHFPDCGKTFTKTAHLQVCTSFYVIGLQDDTTTSSDSPQKPCGHPALHLLSAPLWCKLCQKE